MIEYEATWAKSTNLLRLCWLSESHMSVFGLCEIQTHWQQQCCHVCDRLRRPMALFGASRLQLVKGEEKNVFTFCFVIQYLKFTKQTNKQTKAHRHSTLSLRFNWWCCIVYVFPVGNMCLEWHKHNNPLIPADLDRVEVSNPSKFLQ